MNPESRIAESTLIRHSSLPRNRGAGTTTVIEHRLVGPQTGPSDSRRPVLRSLQKQTSTVKYGYHTAAECLPKLMMTQQARVGRLKIRVDRVIYAPISLLSITLGA